MKLTEEESYEVLKNAVGLLSKTPSLRLGQALMVSLPEEHYKYYSNSCYDFFYWKDHNKVMKVFDNIMTEKLISCNNQK